ncbi:MAG TPA: ribose-phosphate pyrophosphokinase [Allosphingosinicella sp.]|nr:ribose-phosphate pyrophosphokinase [Allosphingosinicella sp.]
MPALAEPAEVRDLLVAAAKAGTALSYGELLERLGYSFSRPKMRALCAILGSVDEEGLARGEPELAVLVVRRSDGLPGQGWWAARGRGSPGTTAECRGQSAPEQGGGRTRGYEGPWEGPEAARFIAEVQAQTFAWWQSGNGTVAAEPAG